ncbi:MAG TPA: hypothetical protein VF474_10975 [Phenylobacterium sp.]
MKIALLATATAAIALLGGAASAQDRAPTAQAPGSTTADPNQTQPPVDADRSMTSPGSTSSTGVAAPPVDTGVTSSMGATDTSASSDANASAPAASSYAQSASVTSMTVTNGPVPDTAENRAKYGQPMSRAGKRTPAKGN